ncbi:hypothetical protein [Streptomyces sp. NPDC002588]|uniref:hypothetical protein n=1 Tax=Streptomyces sp. NPDC002588 TaxID=3154419 RepID=UPI00332D50F4
MGLFSVLLSLVLLGGSGLWVWGRARVTGRWWPGAGWFLGAALLLMAATGVTYLAGSVAAGGFDPEEACHRAGQVYDDAYRRTHFDEYTQWFPLHDRCHAGYDLVPGWVNPALVVLPVLAVVCLAFSVWLAVLHRRTKRGTP